MSFLEITDDGFKLSSGKEIYANRGILGINAELNEITYGYDGEVWIAAAQGEDWGRQLTKEELSEVCDYMSDLWVRFKEKHCKA